MTRTPDDQDSPIAFDAHRIEAKRAGQDGYYWPFDRRRMVYSQHIRARMAEDMQAILDRYGPSRVIVTDDLLRLGWTGLQIDAHRERATDLIDCSPTGSAAQNPMVA